jgi:hypothetical protein
MWHLIAVAKRQYRVRRAINELTLRWTSSECVRKKIERKMKLAATGVGFEPIPIVAGPRGKGSVRSGTQSANKSKGRGGEGRERKVNNNLNDVRGYLTASGPQDKARMERGNENAGVFGTGAGTWERKEMEMSGNGNGKNSNPPSHVPRRGNCWIICSRRSSLCPRRNSTSISSHLSQLHLPSWMLLPPAASAFGFLLSASISKWPHVGQIMRSNRSSRRVNNSHPSRTRGKPSGLSLSCSQPHNKYAYYNLSDDTGI